MIALCSIDPSYGNCVGIYQALSKRGTVGCYFQNKDKKGMHNYVPFRSGIGRVPTFASKVFVVGGCTLERIFDKYPRSIEGKKITVILTDTYYRLHFEKINSLLNGARVFCMPDVSHLCPSKHKIFYHPFEYYGSVKKSDDLTICHSPYNWTKMEQKGTCEIARTVNKLKKRHTLEFDVVLGLSWKNCMGHKASAHIFIDQIVDTPDYKGGLGKSGIEAMACGCLTITSGVFQHDGPIPPPPAVVATPDTLEEVLEYYIENEQERLRVAGEQKQWVQTYLNYEFQSRYLS